MKKKMNCWSFSKCGRGPRGPLVKDLGPCPAAAHEAADGVNGGINGGRICWAIAGTYSLHEKPYCKPASNGQCYDCEFHRRVLTEEGIITPAALTSVSSRNR